MTTTPHPLPDVPADFEVRPLGPDDPAVDRVTCGTCGRSWDDAVVTGSTPAPSGRCPFEPWHPAPVDAGRVATVAEAVARQVYGDATPDAVAAVTAWAQAVVADEAATEPHYHGNAHQPGYLPMADEVPTFATAGAAWEWVAGELERDWDQAVDGWVGDGGPGLEMRGYASGLANAMIAAVEVATGTGYADPITDEGLALVGAMVRVIRAVTAPREVVPPATDQSDVVDIVTARGAEDGRTAAGLVFDGNTTEDTYRAVLTGLEDGDPAVVDPLPSPTVTAGELAEWLAERTGLPADTFDGQRVEETYEAAFGEGLAWEVERVARYHLYPPDGSISHGQARVIASEWHGGQASPLYALASSGAVDLDRVVTEVDMCLAAADSAEDMRLRALRRYVRTCGSRGPVRGWSDLWDESPVSEDQADEAAL